MCTCICLGIVARVCCGLRAHTCLILSIIRIRSRRRRIRNRRHISVIMCMCFIMSIVMVLSLGLSLSMSLCIAMIYSMSSRSACIVCIHCIRISIVSRQRILITSIIHIRMCSAIHICMRFKIIHVSSRSFSLIMTIITRTRNHTFCHDYYRLAHCVCVCVCYTVILRNTHSLIYSIRRTRISVPIRSIRSRAMTAIMRSRKRIMLLPCVSV